MRTRSTADWFPRDREDPPRFRPPLVLRAGDLRADDLLLEDFRADDLRAVEPRRDDFFADDFLPEPPRLDDFLAEEPRPGDFLAELERPLEVRDRERLLPPDLRPPDFLDVAMKRLRK